ncbi:unnamed protein product [Clonostachys byssicola]|uniref:RRM domain-containing protein n=1 Tax=Clonostachys byssicola TaxID=160290 RepID=A0A9N9XZ43_9HYPO|nr:unnamed protein product [Clonostachys byssicola]
MPIHMVPRSSKFVLDHDKPNESRRVTISNLPSGVSIAQVLRGVRGFGSVADVFLFDTAKVDGQGTKAAAIEFVSGTSATTFAWSASSTFYLEYEDSEVRRTADVWLVPGRTHRSKLTSAFKNITRRLRIDKFPIHAVWFFICAVGGEKAVVYADYNHSAGYEALTIEFVSLGHSAQAYGLLLNKEFPFYHPSSGSLHWIAEDETRLGLSSPSNSSHTPDDSSNSVDLPSSGSINYFADDELADDGSESDLPSPHPGCRTPPDNSPKREFVAYIAPNQLAISFDKVPYNEDWPVHKYRIMDLYHLEPHSREKIEEARKNEVEMLAKCLGLNRKKWSWEATYEGSYKLACFSWDTLLSSMNNQRLERVWGAFFHKHQRLTINLQKWEAYGRLAQHRRELCEQQGLPDGDIPNCSAACEFGCLEIKDTPVSDVIREFLEQEWN